jgi:hypothetical protein
MAIGRAVSKHLVLAKGCHVHEREVNEYGPGHPVRNADRLPDSRIFIRPSRRKVAVFEGRKAPMHCANVFCPDPGREG